jgi:predicted metal-dependent HD superfamily phosphohydrolase
MDLSERCETDWADTVSRSGLTPSLTGDEFLILRRAYAEPHRHYHTLRHVEAMMTLAVPLERRATDFPSVLWAIWYHDAIYDPRAADNEERSADWAKRSLNAWGVDGVRVDRVVSLILRSKHDGAAPSTPDEAIFLDADLAILGSDPELYDQYARAIRGEYAFVPEAAYRAGRAEVLRTFLQRPRLYFTDVLFRTHESRARSNLRREIGMLTTN